MSRGSHAYRVDPSAAGGPYVVRRRVDWPRPGGMSARGDLSCEPLVPFGLSLRATGHGARATMLHPGFLRAWVRAHRVLLLRGFAPLVGDELPSFAQTLGELLRPGMGAVEETDACRGRVARGKDQEVALHWDRVAGRSPKYLVFHCDSAPPPGAGGETLFTDTLRVLARATPADRAEWARASIVGRDPSTGEEVLRYVEPLEPRDACLGATSLPRCLYDPAVCYAHPWRDGDVLVADNHSLLHGRAPFAKGLRRTLRRIHVA